MEYAAPMAKTPSPNGSNGRDSRGRLADGNAGGPGNPHAKRAARLRANVLEAVTEDEMRAVVTALVSCAKDGDVAAARDLLNRLLEKPVDVLAERKLELCERRLDLEEERLDESYW